MSKQDVPTAPQPNPQVSNPGRHRNDSLEPTPTYRIPTPPQKPSK